MMKNIYLLLLVFLCFITSIQAQNDLPFTIPLTSDVGFKLIENDKKTATGLTLPNFSDQGMMMSVDEKSIFSGAYFSDLSFNIAEGFVIEFDYDVYSKSVSPTENKLGDGFALVLFDGSVTNPTLGSKGSALGYVYNRNLSGVNPGLTGGYLAIGFDSYGHFNQQGASKDVSWRTGLPYTAYNTGLYTGSVYTDYVTIRGPVNKALDGVYSSTVNNITGYPVLITQNTYANSTSTSMYYSQLKSSWTSADGIANIYTKKEINTFTPFTIAGNQQGATYPSKNARRAKVEMIPDGTASGVFYLSVSVIIDDVLNPRQVIKKYKIDTNSSITYPEVKNYATGVTPSGALTPTTMSMKAPSTLKLGWTASTGDAWAYTVIKNASVTLPYVPIVMDDSTNICKNVGSYSIFNPISNDYGYDVSTANATTDPTPDNAYIDKTSFRFMVPKESEIGYLTNDSNNPYIRKTSYATYTYNPSTGDITSESTSSSITVGTKDTLYYDIKNLNAKSELHRSKVAMIIITFTNDNCNVKVTDPVATNDAATVCNIAGSTATVNPIDNDFGYVSASTTGNSSNIDLTSFSFITSAAQSPTQSPTQTQTTTYASYVYDSATGKLTITRNSTAVTTGTKDYLYYTVKNKNGTVSSNVAMITVTLADCISDPVATNDVVSVCNTAGSTATVNPIDNDLGYVSGSTVGSSSNIDLTSFTFTTSAGVAKSPTQTQTTTYANCTYDSTSGKLTITRNTTAVTSGTIEYLYYTVKNKNETVGSNVATITITYDNSICALEWIKINGSVKGMFINGIGGGLLSN